MAEAFNEQELQGFNFQHWLGIAQRRYLHFLLPMFVGWLVVWGLGWVLPARYKSSTLILVEQPTMPKDYVTPNVNDDIQERLQSITQQILSRTRLLHIIDEFNLYAGKRAQAAPDDKVEQMRKDIQIELVHDARNQVTAFNVIYSSRDPHIAQQVTSELTNLFINENLEVRQQQSEDTTKFLETQLESAQKSLAEQEEKIREFKGQHVGELPTQLGSNLQILSGLQSQLQSEQNALNAARQQKVYLETLVNQYRTLQPASKASDTAPVGGLPAIDQELDRLKAQLADLRAHYTERHPDVRKVKDQIANAEKTRAIMLADQQSRNTNPSPDSPAGDGNQSSPLFQIQGQVRANEVEIKNREEAIAGLKLRINDYQLRLNDEPVREQQLADLTRGYDQSKANYDELLKKKNQSAMATSMELMQQGERFRVLDAPSLPERPDFPDRLKFCAMGLGAGLALGALVAGIFEMVDDRIYTDKEIKDLLPTAVMSEIPLIVNVTDEKKAKRKIVFGWVAAAIVAAIMLAGSAVSYLRG